MAVLGLRFCARAFSSCGKRGPLFIAVRGPLTIAAPPVAEHRLQTRRLSSCGSRGQLLRGMWDLPRPGLEPVSPALAGRFSATAPPGKPSYGFYMSSNKYPSYMTNSIRLLIPWKWNHCSQCIYSKSPTHSLQAKLKCIYCSPPLSTVLPSTVSDTFCQPRSENTKWKISEINNS